VVGDRSIKRDGHDQFLPEVEVGGAAALRAPYVFPWRVTLLDALGQSIDGSANNFAERLATLQYFAKRNYLNTTLGGGGCCRCWRCLRKIESVGGCLQSEVRGIALCKKHRAPPDL
jgi:hypothetical protein